MYQVYGCLMIVEKKVTSYWEKGLNSLLFDYKIFL